MDDANGDWMASQGQSGDNWTNGHYISSLLDSIWTERRNLINSNGNNDGL